jgi:HPt (histidine-containing phosphotransfer) domain-containing protein
LETLCGKTDEWYKNEEDMRKFVITVHGIKSALGSIGENEIAELAYKLEMAGRNRDTDVIPQFTPKLIKNLQSLLENFESKQGNDGTDDIENICGILSEIQQMCAMYDRKGALDLITSVKDCSKKTRETLNNIMGYVIHSEFDDAGNAAGLYLEMVQKGNVASKLSNKEIPGLNITKGLHRYDDDEEVYLKILRSYSSSVRSMLSIIENFSEDKIGDYRIKVHGIKGTSFDVFAEQVGKEASALEDAAKAGNFKYIEENNPIFVENVRKLVYDIDTLLSILDMENPKPRKDKPDHVWLSMLLAACKDYDMDKADAAFAEIEKYQYESDDGLAEWLREQIEKMDFTTIVKKLSDL